MSIDERQRLADLASTLGGAAGVLSRHRLDYWCQGQRTLAEACQEAGVALDVVRAELAAAAAREAAPPWLEAPLGDVVQHLLAEHHAPVRGQLEALRASAQAVAALAHVPSAEARQRLAALTLSLCEEQHAHLAKEEQVVFPWIARGQGGSARVPIAVMVGEHEATSAQLQRLTDAVALLPRPLRDTPEVVRFARDLEAFARGLEEHMHLENNVLFPRALAGR